MAFGSLLVQERLDFQIQAGEVFVVMGGSGCGKSTLLRHLIGLIEPASGEVLHGGESFTKSGVEARERMVRKCGVLFQQGALWSNLTLAENVTVPLKEYSQLGSRAIREMVRFKLALVGLRGFEDFYPSQISGGMRKRAGLARAMALDPEVLLFDEPSAGLDPVSSQRLDETILKIRDSLGTTVVIITHELSSLFAVADRALFLDAQKKTMTALGPPLELLKNPPNESVEAFLTRNGTERI